MPPQTRAGLPSPPRARRHPRAREHHGHRVSDPWEWLRDTGNPRVVAHLAAENAYAEAMTAHLQPLRERIFQEIRSRVLETDMSVPVAYRGFWYYTRSEEGRQYPLVCRVPVLPGVARPAPDSGRPVAGEQVLLDGNAEADGHDFFALGDDEVGNQGRLLAYSVDVTGEERFDLRIKDLATGAVIDEAVRGVGYGVVWSLDDRYLFYVRLDDAWRPHEVWRHEVGTPAAADECVFREPDERFWVAVGSARDDRTLLVVTGSKTTSETWRLPADDPTGRWRVVAPRREGVEYDVEPAGDRLLITHNANRADFEVGQAPLDATSGDQWTPLLAPGDGERVLGVEAFATHLVVSVRRDGLTGLRVIPRDPAAPDGLGMPRDLDFPESLFSVCPGSNPDYAATVVQYGYESMVTPRTVSEYDVATGVSTVLKRQPVLGGYDPADYVQRREWARAGDGRQVPLSVVHRRDTPLDGSAPGYVYGYGAYELSMDPYFSATRLSLLDRGFVFAIAHVRGGGELGRRWYEEGRLASKENSFRDFLACADHLVTAGLAAGDRLVAEGGSAGGLLVGAAVNLDPGRFRAVHASAPFVDVVTTMLDPAQPLTVTEREEWGDPLGDRAAYELMSGYSPYENVQPATYPAILATASLHDTRVSVGEPAKWVQRLRAVAANDPHERPILLRTQLVAGHEGRSGRYDVWREYAWELAFLLDQVGAG